MTAPVFLSPLAVSAGGTLRLDGPEGRHAAVVRRLRVGERVDVTDGRGRLHCGVIAAVGKETVDVSVESVVESPAPSPRVVVVQALPKGDRGPLAVELLTEVGVDVIVPWAADRCITQWRGDKVAKGVEKWRAVAREAAKQSRRTWEPVVADLASTADVVALLTASAAPIVLHESAEAPLSERALASDGDVVLVIGPEGSLTEVEVERFVGAGAELRRMEPTVMRTSTAGAVAASVVLSRSRWR